jgi:neutral ceramidase
LDLLQSPLRAGVSLRAKAAVSARLLPFLGALLLSGCLALDYTPLQEQPFYEKAQARIEALELPRSPSGPLLAGSARADITPPVGLPLGGHRGRKSTGIHAPVFARALVLSNGETTVALVSAELIAVTPELSREVAARLPRELPLAPENLLVTATHTHSGPGAMGTRLWQRLAAGAFDPASFERTAEGMAQAVAAAHSRLQPSRLLYRRFEAPDLVSNRVDPEGVEDPEVQVLTFESTDGAQVSHLVNFSAHPTVLGSRNRLVSGDFPGFLSRALEEKEGTTALYTSGALADQKPWPPEAATPIERAEKMGKLLALRIGNASPSAEPVGALTLWARRISIPLPPPQPRVGEKRRLPSWVGRLFFDDEADLQILGLGRILLVGVPAELGCEVGLDWKKEARARGKEAVVVGFSNGYIGYAMPSSYYGKPLYEARMSLYGPYAADYLNLFVTPLLSAATEQDGR